MTQQLVNVDQPHLHMDDSVTFNSGMEIDTVDFTETDVSFLSQKWDAMFDTSNS